LRQKTRAGGIFARTKRSAMGLITPDAYAETPLQSSRYCP
jgi:hypothetical protein